MTYTSKEFNQQYYEEHKAAGIDYLNHGHWQQAYAQMIYDVTLMKRNSWPHMLDIGCACGSIVEGFRSLGKFGMCFGIDVNRHMIELGKAKFNAIDVQLQVGDASQSIFHEATINLIHSAQVLEHIPLREARLALAEMRRVIHPDGVLFITLDAIKEGQTAEDYAFDPTHCNILRQGVWDNIFHNSGFKMWTEAFERFARHPGRVDVNHSANFFQAYPNWSTWILRPA